MSIQRDGWFVALIGVVILCLGSMQSIVAYDGAPPGDDTSSHLAEVLRVADELRRGDSDFWFDGANLGYGMFTAYQPLPALSVGALIWAMDLEGVAAERCFRMTILLLWGLMPLAWWCGCRLAGMSRRRAFCTAVLSLSVSEATGFGLTIDSTVRTGLWTQLFATTAFPLWMGICIWALRAPKQRAWTIGVACSVLGGLHFFFGALGAGLLALLGVLGPRSTRLSVRAWIEIAVSTMICSAWYVTPVVLTLPAVSGIAFPSRGVVQDGAYAAIATVLTGDQFDHDRWPLLTIAVVWGCLVAVARGARLERAMLVFLAFCSAGWLSPALFGSAMRGVADLTTWVETRRFLFGIGFAGIVLAGFAFDAGIAAVTRVIERFAALKPWHATFFAAMVACALTAAVLVPQWQRNRDLFTPLTLSTQQLSLVESLEGGKGRVLADPRQGAGSSIYRNYIPLVSGTSGVQSYGRGYHDTDSLFFVDRFDFSPEQFDLFAIDQTIAAPATLRRSPSSSSYFAGFRVAFVARGAMRSVRETIASRLTAGWSARMLPLLDSREDVGDLGFETIEVPPANGYRSRLLMKRWDEIVAKEATDRPLTSVRSESHPGPGEYVADVSVPGPDQWLLLKVSFHPFWNAWVDAVRTPVFRVAPNFLAVKVAPGEHTVRFRYELPLGVKMLFILFLGVLPIAAWAATRVSCARS